jgi:Flp pilus assembly protein TadG
MSRYFRKGTAMNRQGTVISNQRGFALIYMAATLTLMLLATGLAVDSGRAYVVKAQLSKAVDGAALGAARNINGANPSGTAAMIFKANFPAGYFGTSSVTDPTTDLNFFKSSVDAAKGINVVTVTATAVLPTTFMKLANFNQVTVSSTGQATRRMVDLSLVLDVSGSIASQWPTVRDAARTFVDSFDGLHDRMSLILFSNGASVIDAMPASRGFNKLGIEADIPNTLPSGSTNMVEGMYRGWDQLRTVPAGTQSGLRIIVLFTDGASNGVPGKFDNSGIAKTLKTADFPYVFPDPDGQTHQNPNLGGFYDTGISGNSAPSPNVSVTPLLWSDPTTLPAPYDVLPLKSWHQHFSSGGIPTGFFLQTNLLTVNGVAQNSLTRRGLRNPVSPGVYPADVWNTNNAARNLLEIISDAARSDNGDYQIRIYTIGMGVLVRYLLGTMPEMPEDILKRIANDAKSPDKNLLQLEGKYFFAPTAADVAPAFQGIQNQILRLSK